MWQPVLRWAAHHRRTPDLVFFFARPPYTRFFPHLRHTPYICSVSTGTAWQCAANLVPCCMPCEAPALEHRMYTATVYQFNASLSSPARLEYPPLLSVRHVRPPPAARRTPYRCSRNPVHASGAGTRSRDRLHRCVRHRDTVDKVGGWRPLHHVIHQPCILSIDYDVHRPCPISNSRGPHVQATASHLAHALQIKPLCRDGNPPPPYGDGGG